MPKSPHITQDQPADAKYIETKPKDKRRFKTKLKEKLFVDEYLKNGMNATQAAMKVYPNYDYHSARTKGTELLTNIDTQVKITDEVESWLNPDEKRKTVDEIKSIAFDKSGKILGHKVKTLELMTKIQNLQTEKIEKRVTNLNIDIDLTKLSPEELQKLIVDGLRVKQELG